ncbi:hypothetical protein PO909_019245 [Leuciscus waleckii]
MTVVVKAHRWGKAKGTLFPPLRYSSAGSPLIRLATACRKNGTVSWLTPEIPQQTLLLSSIPSSLTFSGYIPYCKSKKQ